MVTRERAPSGEGWISSDDWVTRARRLGPLRYSDLGSRRLSPSSREETEPIALWLAQAADQWWSAIGRPDPYTLVVVSGDDGRLARAVIGRNPKCAAALRYVLVNPDHAGRSGLPPGLARMVNLEEPAFLYPSAPSPATPGVGPDVETADDELDAEERPPARGIGPLATFLTEVPALGEQPGAIVAVEAVSRLPYDLYEKVEGAWCEIRVAAEGDGLAELAVPTGTDPPPPGLPPAGTRWRHLTGAVDWLRRRLPTGETGVIAVVDDWTGAGEEDALDLDQLRAVREPLDAAPRPVEGTRRSVVTWRLG